jgi:hypothetical protein
VRHFLNKTKGKAGEKSNAKAYEGFSKSASKDSSVGSATGSGTTSSGPSHPGSPKTVMAEHAADQQNLAAAMANNETKAAEYGYAHAIAPSAQALVNSGQAVEFLKDQFKHCKTILVLGGASALLEKAGIPFDAPDAGLIFAEAGSEPKAFIAALAKHRHVERDRDPPIV